MVNGEIVRTKLTQGLSQGQADALMLMIKFLSIPGPDMFVLKGYAGTGKTYLVKELINYIVSTRPGSKIAVTAPTNKAVQVLMSRKEYKGFNISYQTIHSLLGLTENISNDGKITFTSKGDGGINKIKYLIIDETSMLQDEIFYLIKKHSSKVKIIFIGDFAQIPPVGKIDCIPFKESLSTHFEEGYTLTEIMRQAKGNPIIENSFILRDNLKLDNPIPVLKTQKDDNGHGLIYLNPQTDREELLHLFETHFTSSHFLMNPDYAKVIAWRNKTVATANRYIREMIYKGQELRKIMAGEKVLANKPIFDKDGDIQFNTSEELEINSCTTRDTSVFFGTKSVKIRVYECGVLSDNNISPRKGFDNIRVLHEDSEADYTKFLEELKQRAIDTAGKGKSWIDYYDAMKWPADVVYNYAITAHKS